MNRNNLHTYHLRLTTLSPVHIGTGEVYEPTGFIIDEGKLYEFNPMEFYLALDGSTRKNLENLILNEQWIDIIHFYRTQLDVAKKITFNQINIVPSVEKKYKALLNEDGTENTNQFLIEKTYIDPNTFTPVIPGSSLKGVLTSLLKITDDDTIEKRQELIISDSTFVSGDIEIGYSYRMNKEKNQKTLPQMLAVIKSGSVFHLTIKTTYTWEQIKNSAMEFYRSKNDKIDKVVSSGFIARIGKYCGQEFMIDQPLPQEKLPKTYTIYGNNEKFGWVELSNLDEEKNLEEKEYQSNIDYFLKSDDIQAIQHFIDKHPNGDRLDELIKYKERVIAQKQQNRHQEVNEKFNRAYEVLEKKKGNQKQYKKEKEKFIKKWKQEKNHKNSEYILKEIDKLK